jgi:pyruvate-ferredoxin/flavodoxin oxidoreductase
VNILVLDTQVYSNTGGQQSKATPLSAVAKFAADGKGRSRKMLGPIAMTYRDVYVASVAMGAKDGQTVQALQEAESYEGPSLVIAYSHCIAHGYSLHLGLEQQKLAVDTGFWPLLRYDPRRAERGQPALQLDSGAPKQVLSKFLANETRFRMLEKVKPERARELAHLAQEDATAQHRYLERLAKSYASEVEPAAPAATPETK